MLALGAGATFVARSLDGDTRHLIATLERAARHKGTSFIEVLQNCVVYNDNAFADFADRPVRAERTISLEHGKPLVFGSERNFGLVLDATTPKVVELGDGFTEEDLLVHDEARDDPTVAFALARLQHPESPVPLGVLRAVNRPTYDTLMDEQVEEAVSRQGAGNLEALLAGQDAWTVE